MKATGIVRRIDDLGRVVIPKEIRRTLRIREGDPLEIFTDREGEIILKKYSPIGELSAFAKQYAESLSQTTGHLVCICDMDQIIAVSGNGKKDFQEKRLTKQMQEMMLKREHILTYAGEKKFVQIIAEQSADFDGESISPIICEGDVVGAVALLSKGGKKQLGESGQKLVMCAASFLGKQMEQ
ncbi:MAG: stage V sporulation protein T [Dorea sp.]